MSAKHLFFLLFFLFFKTYIALAQKNFVEGIVVFNVKDTARGWVDDQNWDKAPKQIFFSKEKSGAKFMPLSPQSMLSFSVSGEEYVSRLASIDKSPTRLEDLSYSKESIIVEEHLFFKVLAQGTVALYYHKDEASKSHFFLEKNNKLEELRIVQYLFDVNNQKSIRQRPLYKVTLNSFLNDCSTLSALEINNADLTEKQLISLIEKYNLCQNTLNTVATKTNKFRFEFLPILGASTTSLRINGALKTVTIADVYWKNSLKPYFAGSLDLIFPRNRGNLAFCNEVAYKQYRFLDSIIYRPNLEDIRVPLSLNYAYIKWAGSFKYNFYDNNKNSIFLKVGIFSGKTLKNDNLLKYPKTIFSDAREDKVVRLSSTTEWGTLLAVGTNYKRFLGEFRYEHGSGPSSSTTVLTSTNTFYLLFGYRLFSLKR